MGVENRHNSKVKAVNIFDFTEFVYLHNSFGFIVNIESKNITINHSLHLFLGIIV